MKRSFLLLFLLLSGLQIKSQILQKEITIDNWTFNYRASGDPSDPPVILLHGWPETSHMWIELMDSLSGRGLYCIAPDQRGFSPNARPEKVKDYEIRHLVEDIRMLKNELGFEQFHLIGHDWGSAIGWSYAYRYPDDLLSYSALSVPHLIPFGQALRSNKEQKKMSKYMALFQLRGIPESYLLRKDRKALREAWSESSAEQIGEYLKVLGNKPALKASLSYYRANYKALKRNKMEEIIGPISVPTLFIWGNKDIAVSRAAALPTKDHITGKYTFVELEAGHWLMQEAFEECLTPILRHIVANRD